MYTDDAKLLAKNKVNKLVNIKLYDATWDTDPKINIADQEIIFSLLAGKTEQTITRFK